MYFPYGIMSWGGGIEDDGFYFGSAPSAYAYAWVQENGDQLIWERPYFSYINDTFKKKVGIDIDDSYPADTYSSVWQLKDALERVKWDPDLKKFRSNLRDAIADTNITMDNGEKIKIPGTNKTFVPALEPFGWKFIKYDANGISVDKPGIMSMNLGGVRCTLYPKWRAKLDAWGPMKIPLPLPGWDVRDNWPNYVHSVDALKTVINQANDPESEARWGVWGTAAQPLGDAAVAEDRPSGKTRVDEP
jgi:hypothetical protein